MYDTMKMCPKPAYKSIFHIIYPVKVKNDVYLISFSCTTSVNHLTFQRRRSVSESYEAYCCWHEKTDSNITGLVVISASESIMKNSNPSRSIGILYFREKF